MDGTSNPRKGVEQRWLSRASGTWYLCVQGTTLAQEEKAAGSWIFNTLAPLEVRGSTFPCSTRFERFSHYIRKNQIGSLVADRVVQC